jgi:hypothetical protein
MWQQIEAQSEGAMRDVARVQLWVLDALDEADRLAELARKYTRRTGHPPGSLRDLMSVGLLDAPPVDITGVPFEYDAGTGQVTIGRSSRLNRPR